MFPLWAHKRSRSLYWVAGSRIHCPVMAAAGLSSRLVLLLRPRQARLVSLRQKVLGNGFHRFAPNSVKKLINNPRFNAAI